MSNMNSYLQLPCCGLLVLLAAVQAQAACPADTLWEPYSEVCADVRDVQGEFLPVVQKLTAVHSDAPVPGTMSTGTAYAPDQLVSRDSGRLHTRMFVYPSGLERDAPLPAWLYTTATSRVDNGLEVVAMYTEDQETGYLGLFAWTCLPDYPCPDGAKIPAWQWSRSLPELSCNITQIVDQGGHAQKQLYYANHSDRMDDGSPPLWKSAVYLWNYCDAAWDLAWEHVYRQDKIDCSVPGAACAWWGPSVEIFGDAVYPQIGELGYEDSLLYHDGTWSWLLPPETQFRDPANPSWGSLTPWQLFHLEPNRSYGIGNWFNVNDAPVIESQEALNTGEGEPLTIDTSLLTISDADIDPAYHVDYKLRVYAGNNYTYWNDELTPDAGFTGTLIVPISVSDGAAESATFQLLVNVGPDNSAPVIQGQVPLETLEDQPVIINIDDLIVDYPGGDVENLAVIVHAGQIYTYIGTTVTPSANFSGVLSVPVTVSDGLLESDAFELSITVVPVNDAPSINGQHPLQTLERTPIEITAEDLLLSDPDHELWELSVRVLDGTDYQRVGNTVTPEPGVIGMLNVKVLASDGELDSDTFDLSIQVIADSVPPEISLIGSAAISVGLGNLYTDAGASATDNVDGDISDRIVVDNPVNTDRAGTYTISYSVEDLAGNAAIATRTVIVEVAAPVERSSGGGAVSILVLAMLLAFVLHTVARRHLTEREVMKSNSLIIVLSLFAANAVAAWEALPELAPAPADNPTTVEKVDLGKMLFFDPRFSATGTVSCFSCHNVMEGGDDHRSVSIGVHGQTGGRNAPTVWNAAFLSSQFWDGRAATLEEQAVGPVTNPIEMGMESLDDALDRIRAIPGYKRHFDSAFGPGDNVTMDNAAKAIAAYERTLITPNSLFDRYVNGEKSAMSEQAVSGMQTFEAVGCTSCHSGAALGGPAMPAGAGFFIKFPTFEGSDILDKYDLLEDDGRYTATGNVADKNVWRVPTLRNLTYTAPYFHNGAVKSLEEAVVVMAETQLNREIDSEQVADMVSFLESLTGVFPTQTMPRLPPTPGDLLD